MTIRSGRFTLAVSKSGGGVYQARVPTKLVKASENPAAARGWSHPEVRILPPQPARHQGTLVMLISIAPGIAFDPREVEESFVRASGPGGQNVNKVSSAVQLRLDLRRAGSLPEALRERAERLGGRRVSKDGVLVITAQRHRSQDRNRQDALDRLVALLRDAAVAEPSRIATRTPRAARRKRLDEKGLRAATKLLRARPSHD